MTAADAGRLVEFARACKAAARVVSMYPASHPNIQSALARMVEAGTAATADGVLEVGVLPDRLLVDRRGLAKPDATVSELAGLLHSHQIGEVRLVAPLDAMGWHRFLTLVGTPADAVRAQGGFAAAWEAAGGDGIEVREIDYAEVLRERSGEADETAEWDEIIASCLVGDARSALDERALATLLDIARDPERLSEFLSRLQERARAAGHSGDVQRQAVLRLLHGLANYAAQHAPDDFDDVMSNVATGATRLSADLMLSLLTDPPPQQIDDRGLVAEGVDLGGEVRARFTDDRLGAFVAENVVRERGATSRLAEAFNALATPESDRRTALALAEERVALSPLGSEPDFNDLWAHAMSLLMSYSDADYVPEEYDRELTTAQTTAVDLEQINDDPPDRIADWLSTVDDDDLRALDQQMLGDLLRLEDRPDAWRSILDLAMARVEQLVLVGDLELADDLLRSAAWVAQGGRPAFADDARAAITKLSEGPLVKHLMLVLRQAPEEDMPRLAAFCQALGPAVVTPLTTAVATEESRLAVRRVKDVLIGFGAAAREPVRVLRDSTNPAVRRIAIEVLRAVGGDVLADLRALLGDADPHVQREAVRAILQLGTNDAFAALEAAVTSGDDRTRDAVLHGLGSSGDERAAPMLAQVLARTAPRGAGEAVCLAAIEALGRSGATAQGIEALEAALYRGEWWAPRRTARLRIAAARALHHTASAAGDAVLQQARDRGPRGVRAAAAEAMNRTRASVPQESPADGTHPAVARGRGVRAPPGGGRARRPALFRGAPARDAWPGRAGRVGVAAPRRPDQPHARGRGTGDHPR
ncbi:MAG: HEAT repeat domain-containing protein [Vicinamibacterales bacterium]